MFSENYFKTISTATTRFARSLHCRQNLNKPAIIFPLAILIFVSFGCRMFSESPHKTDAQLTAEFKQNKEKLDRLVTMVKEDKKGFYAPYHRTNKIQGMSQTRREEYIKLLDELKPLGVFPNKSEKQVEPVTQIYFKSTDYEKKGEFYCKYREEKGFVWYEIGKQPANREVRNLDREYTKGEDVKAESRIDDNWSLYYTYETCYKD